jgi:hypothetical protein
MALGKENIKVTEKPQEYTTTICVTTKNSCMISYCALISFYSLATHFGQSHIVTNRLQTKLPQNSNTSYHYIRIYPFF